MKRVMGNNNQSIGVVYELVEWFQELMGEVEAESSRLKFVFTGFVEELDLSVKPIYRESLFVEIRHALMSQFPREQLLSVVYILQDERITGQSLADCVE